MRTNTTSIYLWTTVYKPTSIHQNQATVHSTGEDGGERVETWFGDHENVSKTSAGAEGDSVWLY